MNGNDKEDDKLIRDDKPINDEVNNNNDEDENHRKKKIKLNEENESMCVICFENDNLLPQHGCKQCNQSSFQICQVCHVSCLSKLCPLCRGEYAPMIYSPYPITLAIPFIASNYVNPGERFRATVTTAFVIEHVIGKVNTAVWWPDDHIMHFVLPIERSESVEETTSDSLLISITLTDDLFSDGNFYFSNKIWDMLEQKAIDEEGEEFEDDDTADTLGEGPDREIEPDEPLYCTCNRVEYGYMINCTKEECPIKWFHFRCVGLSRATTPTAPWTCSSCSLQSINISNESINNSNGDQEPNIRIVNEERKQPDEQEPIVRIVNDEQHQSDESVLEEEHSVSARATGIVNNLALVAAMTENDTNLLNAIEFSQAAPQDGRKWLISKLMKSGSLFYTEITRDNALDELSDILNICAANNVEN